MNYGMERLVSGDRTDRGSKQKFIFKPKLLILLVHWQIIYFLKMTNETVLLKNTALILIWRLLEVEYNFRFTFMRMEK